MDDLLRHLAPISDEAWEEIDREATRVLERRLGGRKVVDFSGPHGWDKSAVNLGRTESIDSEPKEGAQVQLRRVKPLTEVRVPFELSRRELNDVSRGASDAELEPVIEAATKASLIEDRSIFHGFSEVDIEGLCDHDGTGLEIDDEFAQYPKVIAEATDTLRTRGVEGPYAIVLGPPCYTGVSKTTYKGGFPVLDHIRELLDGPAVWSPGVDGAVVLSLRGGDFELTVGQDFAVGYRDHDSETVTFFIQESFTFRVLTPEAAIPLHYSASS